MSTVNHSLHVTVANARKAGAGMAGCRYPQTKNREDEALAWPEHHLPRAEARRTDESFAKLTARVHDGFLGGAQEFRLSRCAWEEAQRNPDDIREAAAEEFMKQLPKRYGGQKAGAYRLFLHNAQEEFLRGLNKITAVQYASHLASSSVPNVDLDELRLMARCGTENPHGLAAIVGWLGEISPSIEDLAMSPAVRSRRIQKLANCAHFLAVDGQATAESMAADVGYTEIAALDSQFSLESATHITIDFATKMALGDPSREAEHA